MRGWCKYMWHNPSVVRSAVTPGPDDAQLYVQTLRIYGAESDCAFACRCASTAMASDISSGNPLLQPVQPDTADKYYTALISSLKATCIEIRLDAGGGRGKGVFAAKNFQHGDVLWTERPLVSTVQLQTNNVSFRVCACCRTSSPASCCCYCTA